MDRRRESNANLTTRHELSSCHAEPDEASNGILRFDLRLSIKH